MSYEYELTILMPCLNEAETLETCIKKAQNFLRENNVNGEVLIADNGSTDGSREIAVKAGARVVPIEQRGYGAALIGGCEAAKGEYVIMGDADDSYDFLNLMPFLSKLLLGSIVIEYGYLAFLHAHNKASTAFRADHIRSCTS